MAKMTELPQPIFDTLDNLTANENFETLTTINKNDLTFAHEFLYSYRGSEATFNAYRRELERLLRWCWSIQKKSLSELRRHDIEQFVEFCQSPPSNWIGTKNVARFINRDGTRIPNPNWRPFVVNITKAVRQQGKQPDPSEYLLSQKALQAIFAVLSSFFNYLIQEEYIALNPIAQMRQKSKFIRKQQSKTVVRRLTELQWIYVIESAEKLANTDPQHERTLFIMQSLFSMYLRISELAASPRWQPQMGDFRQDHDGNWWFHTVGKGNKERMIAVSDAMLKALKRYRQALSLPVLPSPGEPTPLVMRNHGKGAISSTRQIRSIVQFCFDSAITQMQADGLEEEAQQLKTATVHWLRHTGISEDVKHRPREHVRDDAGHGSSAITDRYIDIELRARHASAKKKQIKIND